MMATDKEETRKESRIQHGDAVVKGVHLDVQPITLLLWFFFKKPSDHTHEKLSTPQIDIEKAETSVKRKAVEDIHAYVDKMVCEKISASSLSYKHVHALKCAVYRERCKLRPTIPKSIEDVFCAAESPAFGLESFDVIIRDEPKKNLIITSEDNLLHLSACENILGDGTFKSCPKFFEQLYTLHGYKDGTYNPCVFALLPDKKKPYGCFNFSKVPATKETLH